MEDHSDGDEVRIRPSLLPPVHYLIKKPRARRLIVSHGRTPVASRYVIQYCDRVPPVCQPVTELVLGSSHDIVVLPCLMKRKDGLRPPQLSVALFQKDASGLKWQASTAETCVLRLLTRVVI